MQMFPVQRLFGPAWLPVCALVLAIGCGPSDAPVQNGAGASSGKSTPQQPDVAVTNPANPVAEPDSDSNPELSQSSSVAALVSSFAKFEFRRSPGLKLEAVPEFSGQPQYLILAFGESSPDQWPDFQLGVAIDQTSTYVDLNQNGDLTDSGEKFALNPTNSFDGVQYFESIIDSLKVGEDEHTDVTITVAKSPDGQRKLSLRITLWGWDRWTTGANLIPLVLGNDAAKAPVIQLGGPLQMGSYREVTELVAGSESDFYSAVGTVGSAAGTFAAILNTDIPATAIPLAEFEFPHRDADQPVIRIKTPLTVRC